MTTELVLLQTVVRQGMSALFSFFRRNVVSDEAEWACSGRLLQRRGPHHTCRQIPDSHSRPDATKPIRTEHITHMHTSRVRLAEL